MSKRGQRDKTRERSPSGRSAAEWTTLVVSIGIVSVILGLLLLQQFEGGPTRPVLDAEIRLDDVRREGDQYYLPITVSNAGKRSAERVVVEVGREGEPEPVAEAELEDLPGRSDRVIVVLLEEEPTNDLAAVVTSYIQP